MGLFVFGALLPTVLPTTKTLSELIPLHGSEKVILDRNHA